MRRDASLLGFCLDVMAFARLRQALTKLSSPRLRLALRRNLFTASTSCLLDLVILCPSVARIVTTSSGPSAQHKRGVRFSRHRKAKSPTFRQYLEGKPPLRQNLKRMARCLKLLPLRFPVTNLNGESRVLLRPTLPATQTVQLTPASISRLPLHRMIVLN